MTAKRVELKRSAAAAGLECPFTLLRSSAGRSFHKIFREAQELWRAGCPVVVCKQGKIVTIGPDGREMRQQPLYRPSLNCATWSCHLFSRQCSMRLMAYSETTQVQPFQTEASSWNRVFSSTSTPAVRKKGWKVKSVALQVVDNKLFAALAQG